MRSTATAATVAAREPARGRAWLTAWYRALVGALPLVAIYVVLVGIRDAPLIGPAGLQAIFMSIVVSESVQGLLLAAGVAVVEMRERTRRARVAGYVIVALAATFGQLGAWDGLMIGLDMYSSRWPWWVQTWGNSGPTLVHSLFAIAVYRMWRLGRERAAALRDMQRRRVEVLRETAQADLLAMQARIDPTFLFEALQAIDRAYADRPGGGRSLIDSLIDYLRAALPGTDVATSTLGKECDLARAYLELARARHNLDLRVDVAAASARSTPFPPMLVLPIVGDIANALRARGGAGQVWLRALATKRTAALAIAVEPQCVPPTDTLALVRQRLAELSGGSVTVNDSTITLEVPHALTARVDR